MPAYKKYLLPYRDECHQVIVNNTQLADEIIFVTEIISRELREKVLI
jgi:uridine kinase